MIKSLECDVLIKDTLQPVGYRCVLRCCDGVEHE